MNVTCIRAGVKDLSTAALIAKCTHVEASLLDNPHFPAPTPSLADVRAKRTELQYWLAESAGGAHAAIATRWAMHAQLERLMVQLAKYVMASAQGDIAKQVTSGFETRRAPLRIGQLAAPAFLYVTRTDQEGELRLTWGAVHGARVYQVHMTPASCPAMIAGRSWRPARAAG